MSSQTGGRKRGAMRTAEIDIDEARKAFFLMVGFIALIWVLQIFNWVGHYRLDYDYGVLPRNIGRLPQIFSAPFLHFSWEHIEGNSGPLFIFGFLAAYRGVKKFLGVTLIVAITSGLGAWLFEGAHTVGAGASGMVFGYFAYIIVRGIVDRHPVDLLIGLVMALCFAYQFAVLLPQHGIGWQDHIGGAVGGVLAGWICSERKRGQPAGQLGRPGGAASGDSSRAALRKELDDLGL